VTGSLSGIGLGIAHSLAARGYNIILNGFASDEEIRKTTSDFQTKYPTTEPFYIFADLTKPADCKKIVDETLKKFGRVDVLVNNAGIQHID
jgi:3-hydroxybutyrate dehydrogenase